MTYQDFENHPFNQIVNTLVEKFGFKESAMRVVKITSPKTERNYSYIEIKSTPGRKQDSITNLLINLIKIANNYNPFNFTLDHPNGCHYVEIDDNNKHTGPTLLKLADQMIARDGYEHFRSAFRQLPNLPTDQEFKADTGRMLKLEAYIVPAHGPFDKIIYGFKLVTTDERIVAQAVKLGKMSIHQSSHNRQQFEITSDNGNNQQMSQLLTAIPFIATGKPGQGVDAAAR